MADLSKLRFNGTDYNVKDASAPLRKFTNYSKTGNLPITSDDTTQTAIGKLENALNSKINTSAKGTSNGVAELDANGKVPSSQLPSYVDDVLEYSAKSSFPATGETGKIYVDTTTNKTYRWSGSAYVEISESLALGETSSTAYRGDRGKAAYDHSQVTSGNPHGTTGANTKLTGYSKGSSKDAVAATDTVNAAIAKHENRIDTNQSNILYALRKVGTNMFNFEAWANKVAVTNSGTKSVSENTITISATTNSDTYTDYSANEYPVDARIPVNAGDKLYMSWDYSSADNVTGNVYIFGNASTSSMANADATAGHLEYTVPASGISYISMRVGLGTNQSGKSGTWSNIQIIMKSAYDSGVTDFEPFALPNYDLTRLEAEDRASLAEVVDSGAKNLLQNVRTSTTIKGVTFTVNSDGSVSTYGTSNAADAVFYINQSFKFQSGVKYVLSGCPSGGSADGYRICSMGATYVNEYGDGAECVGDGVTREIAIYVKTSGTNMGTAQSPKIFKPMVCTKAAFGVSPKFVPFGNDPSYQVSINHNMIYRGRNLGASLTDAQHTALSSGNFTDLYLGDYWTKTVTIPAGTYTGGDGEEVTVPAQTNITLKAVIADFDTFYAGYASTYAGINTHHAAVIVTGFSNVVWNKTNSTAGGYVASLIHKWLVGSALPQIETWFGSAKVLSHQKLLTNAITGDAASGWAWSSQKISLLSENQMYGSKVWGNSKAANGGYEPGEAFKHLNVFNHIDANLLFGDRVIWLRDIASAERVAYLYDRGDAGNGDASATGIAPAALILLS